MHDRQLLVIGSAAELNTAAIVQIAHGAAVEISPALAAELDSNRAEMMQALQSAGAVYGVNTGLGAQSERRLSWQEQSTHQRNLLPGRAVGGPPFLGRLQSRAVVASRIATLLCGDAGVSSELCIRLASMLNADVEFQIPATGVGSAGEIMPLAHAFLPLLEQFELGPKEGIALLEGIPGSTALAILAVNATDALLDHAILICAGAIAVIGAPRDPYSSAAERKDSELGEILRQLREAAGPELAPSALQAPISFRVAGAVLAHLHRCTVQLKSAIDRALGGVNDSPAFDRSTRGFIGTAGFYGIDLAAHCDSLAAAVVHAAEMSTAQLHRLLDTDFSGLPQQLTPNPGPECGLIGVHKRAVGILHPLRKLAIPAAVGAIDTSFGQEDLQSFSWQAATELNAALAGWREILACQLLALWRAFQLSAHQPPAALAPLLGGVDAAVPPILGDRPFGLDIEAIRTLLG